MKKTLIAGALIASSLIISGCSSKTVTNNGPSADLLMHGKTSHAKVTYNFKSISKDKKLYIKDITMEQKTDMAEYEGSVNFQKWCSPGENTKGILKIAGYQVLESAENADYIITMENIGCGRYGVIKDKIRTAKMVQIDKNLNMKHVNDATSYANSAANLSSAGGSSNLSGGLAALSILSLLGGKTDYDKLFFSAVNITVENKETHTIENAIYHTFPRKGQKTWEDVAHHCNDEIANRFEMEI